jgi:hypothetical protein
MGYGLLYLLCQAVQYLELNRPAESVQQVPHLVGDTTLRHSVEKAAKLGFYGLILILCDFDCDTFLIFLVIFL